MAQSNSSVEGKITLITGGTGDLGRTVVRRFLEEGAVVHVPARSSKEGDELRSLLGDLAASLHLHPVSDLADPDEVETLVARVGEIAGQGPDILLNLAGGFTMAGIEETDFTTWTRMWQMNASTAFLTSRAVFTGMRARGWGRIVNVSALPALDRGKAGLSAYGASKAALLNLTYTLSKEGVGEGITVNAILPSILDTPGNRKGMPDANTSTWIPPEEVAEVLLFLASDRARTVNGAAIPLTLG